MKDSKIMPSGIQSGSRKLSTLSNCLELADSWPSLRAKAHTLSIGLPYWVVVACVMPFQLTSCRASKVFSYLSILLDDSLMKPPICARDSGKAANLRDICRAASYSSGFGVDTP